MAEKTDKPAEESLAEAIRKRFAPLGGADLKVPPRELADREPPRFDGPEYGEPVTRKAGGYNGDVDDPKAR